MALSMLPKTVAYNYTIQYDTQVENDTITSNQLMDGSCKLAYCIHFRKARLLVFLTLFDTIHSVDSLTVVDND